MAKELTALENMELLVGRLNKQQTLDIVQSYIDENVRLMKSIEQNNFCIKLLNEKLATFVK